LCLLPLCELRRVVEQLRPLIAGKVQVQAPERSEATDGDWDVARHAMHDPRVGKDPPAGHLPNIDQLGPLIPSLAPTEPQVTNVTSATTAGVAVGDDERITGGMLVEPVPRPIVEDDEEFVHDPIMARGGRRCGRRTLPWSRGSIRERISWFAN
jgi:hypothetical protein